MYALRLIVPAVAMICFTACGEDTSGRDVMVPLESTAAVSGTYIVQSVNGGPPPGAVYRADRDEYFLYMLKSGSLTINPQGTFAKTYQLTKDGQTEAITETCTGTYFKDGLSLFFHEVEPRDTTCGGTFSGTFDGSARITLREVDATIVVQK